MPQVVIHMSETLEVGIKSVLVKEVRKAISAVLALEETSGQVILYESPQAQRTNHEDRDPNFVLVETFMLPGRSREQKTALLEHFSGLIHRYTNVNPRDIHIVIHEIAEENYSAG